MDSFQVAELMLKKHSMVSIGRKMEKAGMSPEEISSTFYSAEELIRQVEDEAKLILK